MLIASLVIIGLLLAGASKFYTADTTKQAGQITGEAASTSKTTEAVDTNKSPAVDAAKSETLSYIVKEGDYIEKIVADVCGETGGWVDTRLRNKDRILVGQELVVVCN